LLYLNARSVRNKRNIILKIIQETKPQCLVVTEHWLRREEIDIFSIDNFRKISCFARDGKRGGGVLIMIRNDIQCDTVELQQINENSIQGICEMAAVKISTKDSAWNIIGVYRPPTLLPSSNDQSWSKFLEILHEGLLQSDPLVSNICLVGDFNVDLLKSSPWHLQFKNLLDSCALHPLFNEPTRTDPVSGKSSCLDNIVVNE
jgi:exonuclease III